ncbi:histidinol-phosphate transaminase [Kurthia sibirica]|uniref:Histidinol-phosphate aminotransferase n=1 Tax=Kurthia sibirica TaxID=202750 RepID=A0A2U3AIY2_9BACL|nr:histidinol-phosphate transaminase [Kurthia sibirica]PWI24444.1 histidinol-phosphate transaminase [Kurthia sibirica]GEK35170.1 histidinol-phosphate aminotransferase [Kurthia sibirica]
MKWKESVKGLKAYQPGKSIDAVKKEFGLDEIVKLASNENPLGCSPKVTAYLQQLTTNFALYPDGYATAMREATAKHLGVENNELIFGNGSDELISIITRALLQPGTNTVMATPTFSQYKLNAMIEGAEVREIPLKERAHDLDAMLAAIDEHTAVLWICSPNNPTGGIVEDAPLQQFLAQVPSDILVVLDEAYFEYISHDQHVDTISLLKEYNNIIILRTFSKAYGLAAFRVGYGIANADLIAKLDPVRGPFNNTVLSQSIIPVALADQQYLAKCREVNAQGKKQYIDFCQKHHLDFYPSDTNFILFEVKMDSDLVFQELMSRGYIIRSGNALGVPSYIRVTIGTEQQNTGLLAQLEAVMTTYGVFV